MARPLALWAGVECTLNRIGDRFLNQCEKNGHLRRLSDLELFAQLGAERIRYPCLWETVAPHHPDERDWSWLDERLAEMRRLGLTPIAGLLHHGSGPRYTSLIDPEFPQKFASYARAFAERYPWIEDYTPINEPLTTARFSCLYGFWYPHLRDSTAFVRATFLQAKATLLAMREIRAVNPNARLIQTEDLGRAQATPKLTRQCEFENQRRWLSLDMICGRLGRERLLFNFLKKNGLTEAEQEWLSENGRAPDKFGINHYLLSNRFLDEQRHHYPRGFHGGNGRQRYADVGAVDSGRVTPPTPESVFREAWERYHIPLAVTEVHVRGPREAQMRWLSQIWRAADSLRAEGVDIRAVTAWSLLGTYDWNTLCTRSDGFYEPGVFDLRGSNPEPRPTVMSRMVQSLARTGSFDHPVLDQPGWWMTPRRMIFARPDRTPQRPRLSTRPLVIAGATGTLGRAFARVCESRDIAYRVLRRSEMDIADPVSVARALDEIRPWAVINTAGYVKVDLAEQESERCFRENTEGAFILAQACAERGISLVGFSSDLVFDGLSDKPYTESADVSPLNVYGRSKAAAEQQVLGVHPDALVIRTSSFFGPWDEYNFVTQSLRNLTRQTEFHAAGDVRVSPTYVPDLVDSALDLLLDGERGLLHLTNRGEVSWAELARIAAQAAKLDPMLIVERSVEEFKWPATRPRQSVLASEKVNLLPALDDALARYISQLEVNLGGVQ